LASVGWDKSIDYPLQGSTSLLKHHLATAAAILVLKPVNIFGVKINSRKLLDGFQILL